MMNRQDISSLLKAPHAAGLRIKIMKSGQLILQLVTIAKKKKEIEILKVGEVFHSIQTLPVDQASQLPLFISLDGKGVLHKSLEITTTTTNAELVGKMLPNAHPKDFYLQRSAINEHKAWVSMARKELVDGLLQQLNELGWYPHDFLLGNFSLLTASTALEKEQQPAAFIDEEVHMELNDKGFVALTSTKDEYLPQRFSISGKTLDTPALVAMGNAIQYYLPNPYIHRPVYATVTEHANDFFHKRLFSKLGWTALGTFMMVLLINFLTFDHYSTKHQEVATTVRQNEAMLVQLQQLRSELQAKKNFIAASGFVNASSISYFADQLALTLPKSIKLQQIVINPPIKKRKEGEPISFEFNEIRVVGITNENLDLNAWIKQIKTKKWVKEVSIVDFIQGKRKNGGAFEFNIKVKKDLV
jgi:Tfp pilus assembly protein PilN